MSNEEITPETFKEVGDKILYGEPVADAETDDGFIRTGYTSVLVGYKVEDSHWILCSMRRRSSTVGQNSAKMQTRNNVSIVCNLFRAERSVDGIEPEDIGKREVIDEDDINYIDVGYINGYRTTKLTTKLEDIFKWYSHEHKRYND